ncbi:MAG TPA: metallopeptidase TldD-related protein [Streptosporangiaceae bacterium]|nr:metallopeptidase TldD-related protein [Streptosporangiaceae bacterium]
MSELTPQDAVERALASATCDECVVIAEETSEANLRWAGNTLTTNGVSASRDLTVIAICRDRAGARVGVVSRSGATAEQLGALVAEAEKAATDSSPAEDAQELPGPTTDGAFQTAVSGREAAWDDPPARTEIGVLRGFAGGLGDAFDVAASGGRRLYGFAEHTMTSLFLGSSSGLRLRHDQPSGKVELNAKTADASASAWAGAATRDFTDVDVAGLEAVLARKLGWAARRVELPAGRYETLLPPAAVADLMIYTYWSAGARDALDGRTVFSRPGGGTRVGERLASLPVTLRSDPGAPGLRTAPFVIAQASSRDASVFDNGLPLAPTEWISGGVLTALRQTRYSARLSGLAVTPAIGNLILEAPGPGAPLDDMIARTGRGLLLTCLWYIREVDPQTLLLTGLTRDGVYLVEGGEVTAAVNNFRFNESPVAMLGRIAEAGLTGPALPREWSDYFTRSAMPPLRVEGFNMSSVSQAS